LSCPNYLHADVSDSEDLSLHQQEVTGGQLVTMSLVPGTVDSDASGIGVSPLLPLPLTYGEGVLLGQQLRALCPETELEILHPFKLPCLSEPSPAVTWP